METKEPKVDPNAVPDPIEVKVLKAKQGEDQGANPDGSISSDKIIAEAEKASNAPTPETFKVEKIDLGHDRD